MEIHNRHVSQLANHFDLINCLNSNT